MPGQYVQVAEIEIDPAQLEAYKAAVGEQIATAIRMEPGVLVLYVRKRKSNPHQGFRDLSGYRFISVASRIRSLQDIQSHDGEDGQVAQACPSHAHHARRSSEVTTRYTGAQQNIFRREQCLMSS